MIWDWTLAQTGGPNGLLVWSRTAVPLAVIGLCHVELDNTVESQARRELKASALKLDQSTLLLILPHPQSYC